jgi:hypothetical protein
VEFLPDNGHAVPRESGETMTLDGKPVVPDLPGCTTAAATTDEALRGATEAMRL